MKFGVTRAEGLNLCSVVLVSLGQGLYVRFVDLRTFSSGSMRCKNLNSFYSSLAGDYSHYFSFQFLLKTYSVLK